MLFTFYSIYLITRFWLRSRVFHQQLAMQIWKGKRCTCTDKRIRHLQCHHNQWQTTGTYWVWTKACRHNCPYTNNPKLWNICKWVSILHWYQVNIHSAGPKNI